MLATLALSAVLVLAAPPAADLPKTLFLAGPPLHAEEVAAAKSHAKAKEPIILRGRIGGSKEPFTVGRAVFTLVDVALPICGENSKDDQCPTPWDYCCEPRGVIAAKSASIQVVDDKARLLKADLNGVAGLKPGAEVFVRGVVHKSDNKNLLIVNATGIFARASPAALPEGFFLTEKPRGAIELPDAHRTANVGDKVTIHARSPAKDAFTPGVAEFKVQSAETPEPPAVTSTIRVLGADNKPIAANLETVGGLGVKTELFIVGTVSAKDPGGGLVIDATGIHVAAR